MYAQITERMENVKSDLEKQFTNLYCKKDFEYQLRLAKTSASDRKPQVLKKLADMYNEVGIDCKYNQTLSYYEKLFSKLQVSDSVADVNNKIINMMSSLYTEYPKPEEFMERIVNRLDPDTMLSGSLQLRILRRFLQTINIRGIKGNYKYYSDSLSKQIKKEGIYSIGEEYFKVLDNKSKEKCDYFQLVQASHNLAHGIFISSTSTKELLFLFAFAYGMKYYQSKDQDDYDMTRDVEKNLFVDYYCDNLTRFLVSDISASSGISDNEPSGIVLNPKNFIDVLFVYYLNKENLNTQEKISSFYSKISEVKKEWYDRENYFFDENGTSKFNEAAITKEYNNRLFDIEKISEADLPKYIVNNYYCDFGELYNIKKDEYITNDITTGLYVRYDTDLPEKIDDHIFIQNIDGRDVLIAIEVITSENAEQYTEVQKNQLTSDIIGNNYFVYDEEKGAYRTHKDFVNPYVECSDGYYVHNQALQTDNICLTDHICIENVNGKDTILAIEVLTPANKDSYEKIPKNNSKIKSKIIGSEYFSYKYNVYNYSRLPNFKQFLSKEQDVHWLGPFELKFYKKTTYDQYLGVLDLLKDEMALPNDFEFRKAFEVYDGRVFENDKVDIGDDKYKNDLGEYDLEKYEKDAEKATNKQWRQLCENSNLIGLLSLNENLPFIKETPVAFQDVYKTVIDKIDPQNVLTITDPNNITRTKLIAAYYHFYVWMMTLNNAGDTWRSFKEIYEDFSSCVDQYLIDAGYQEINAKNLFDMLVVFFAYCKVNGFLS